MLHNAVEFDKIAQEIFFPIYAVIADDALSKTGITSGRLLDIGSGGGHLGLSVLKAAPAMTGILLDSDPVAVKIADARITEWGARDRAVAVLGRAEKIPLADGSVDLIVSRGSIHFWDDIEAAFSEILRVLAPGGMTYIGSGMGSKKLSEEIARKMKTANPDWPGCVHRDSKGHTIEDYRAVLKKHGVYHEILSSEENGKWTIIVKK
jgi:ubiquinone/menaquinone biosynthesis C-methylase UbiE